MHVRSRRIFNQRQQHYLKQQQQQQPCTPILDVLGWIMDQATTAATKMMGNHPSPHTLVIVGGSLIKVLREKDFVRLEDKNGTSFIDDDIDVMTSLPTFDFLATLEPMLWKTHGWTIRCFVHCNTNTIFAQLVSVCGGHIYSLQCGKLRHHHDSGGVKQQQQQGYKDPAIDLYPFISLKGGMESSVSTTPTTTTSSVLMDFWETGLTPSSLMFPVRHVSIMPKASTNVLQLQIPSQAETILTCLYGNWHVYSNATTKSFFNNDYIRRMQKCFEEGIPNDLPNRNDAILAYRMAITRQQRAQQQTK
jgi:hypothetical protein